MYINTLDYMTSYTHRYLHLTDNVLTGVGDIAESTLFPELTP